MGLQSAFQAARGRHMWHKVSSSFQVFGELMSVGEQEQVNKNLRIIPIPHPLDAILIPETRPEKHRKQMEFQFE